MSDENMRRESDRNASASSKVLRLCSGDRSPLDACGIAKRCAFEKRESASTAHAIDYH